MSKYTMNKQRKGERRQWGPPPKYPLIDSSGELVSHNRRRTLERRVDIGMQNEDKAISSRLSIYINNDIKELTDIVNKITVGRTSACDITVNTKYASRIHASFECRDGNIVLIDESTNGTYLYPDSDQQQEMHLTGQETSLSGSGTISLGAPRNQQTGDIIRFDVPT